jgi:NADH:ubiquinone reductase (H+-translocating)
MLKKEQPHVVILGGGFAGLGAVKVMRDADVRITLIDRSNHHLFQPLLYQVAAATLAAPDVAAPIRSVLRHQSNVTVWMAQVHGIDVRNKRVRADDEYVDYDYLIVATGMTHAYFGHDEWAEHALGLKTVAEALEIRSRILRAFEAAELAQSAEQRRALTTFVVIGAGPTGVELAGALAEIAGRTLAKDFRRFDPRTTRVILIEAGPRVLPTFSEHLSERARRQLEGLGIEVRTGTPVSDLGDGYVLIGQERIAARTVLWAAGVQASPLTRDLDAPLDRGGRVHVEDDLSVPDHPEVFVTGDLIAKTQDGKPLPGVAQLAIQSGRHAAKNVLLSTQGHARQPFRFKDKGSMATIGSHKAVAQIGRAQFTGFIAWFMWLTVHIFFLVEFRKRIAVLFEWGFAYFTWQRSSRVILEVPATGTNALPNESSVPQQLRPDAEERAVAHAAEPHEAPTRAARLVRP